MNLPRRSQSRHPRSLPAAGPGGWGQWEGTGLSLKRAKTPPRRRRKRAIFQGVAVAAATLREAGGGAVSISAVSDGGSLLTELDERRDRVGRAKTPLTRRESEVLRIVAEGLSDKEIAAKLVISEHTVHRHVSNIRTKLRVPSRSAAAAHAARLDLI